MKDIMKNRLTILGSDNKIRNYEIKEGVTHTDYLDEYRNERGYGVISEEGVIKRGNCLFKTIGRIDNENVCMIYMPSSLTEEQLITLDYMAYFLKNVNRIYLKKYGDDNGYEYEYGGDCQKWFETNIIQSYYDDIKRKKR